MNDRYNKLSVIQQGQLANLNMEERELKRKDFLADLESKLNVHLDFYDVINYHPNTVKPNTENTPMETENSSECMPIMEFGTNDNDTSVKSELTSDLGFDMKGTDNDRNTCDTNIPSSKDKSVLDGEMAENVTNDNYGNIFDNQSWNS